MRSVCGVVAALVSALAIMACGGAERQAEPSTLTGYFTSSPDFLDPALSYTQEGWTALWNVYLPLLTYRHEEGPAGAELIPGLAESLPEISDDGRMYELRLRDGLRFSDGTPVEASDFEHTIERVLSLESGGMSFYLPIVGAEEYVRAGEPGADIEGIVTTRRARSPSG